MRGHLARQLRAPGITAAQMGRAPVPAHGVTGDRDLLTSNAVGGAGNTNRVFFLLGNTGIPPSPARDTTGLSLPQGGLLRPPPHDLAEWRSLAHRRRLELRFSWEHSLSACVQLTSLGIRLPPNPAALELSEVHTAATNSPFPAFFGRFGRFLAPCRRP